MKKNKGFGSINLKNIIFAAALVLFTALLSVGLAFLMFNITRTSQTGALAENNITEVQSGQEVSASEKTDGDGVLELDNDEMRGVWIPSVLNIAYPSQKGLSARQLSNELDAILDTCVKVGFNAVFFQVRPTADSLCKSDIFPQSEYVSGTCGVAADGDFDSLGVLLEKAEKRGIAVHAWVNPFRVTSGTAAKPLTDPNALTENHPARLHPEYTVPFADGKLYFNPGLPEVRELVLEGILEICRNYPTIAGIHLDDYFYPYPSGNAEFDDDEAYNKYGEGLSLADWRRQNVNTFVKSVYDGVKAINPEMRFGVSPFGIWANSGSDTPVEGSDTNGLEAYSALYCDALAWANGGYVDYLVPQVYWDFAHKSAAFDTVARWWNASLDGTGVDLYIGHAAYKAVDYADNELLSQVEFSRSLLTYKGSLFYGYSDICNNSAELADDLSRLYSEGVKYNEETAEEVKTEITYPTSTGTYDGTTYLLGVSDPSVPVNINGRKISRTKDGYFSYYTTLESGDNIFTLTYGNEKSGFKISKLTKSSEFVAPKELTTFEITECTPSKTTWIGKGDTIEVSCSAPSGSSVSARLGGITVQLKPTMYSATTTKNYREVYKGSIKVDAMFAPDGGEADIGTLIFTAEKNGKKATKNTVVVKQLGKGTLIYAEVKNDYTYFKVAPDSSFYDDPTPQQIGMRDYVIGYSNGYYKLRSGYFVSENDVTLVRDAALYENRVLSATVEATVKSTHNNKDNFTDIRLGVLENVPVTCKVEGKIFEVTLHNTEASALPNVVTARNPLIKDGRAYSKDGYAMYEFTLKSAENYYGFNILYEDGFVIIRMNNPQSLSGTEKPLAGKTVILDAGHGGNDIGAPGPTGFNSGLNEADLNLSITLELRDALAQLGANVIMTRDEDSTLDLYSRIDIMASMIPDLAISVHHNSVANTANAQKTRGYLGLYSDNAGVMLANAVADTVTGELARQKRPTSYQMLAVARNHRFPSTLCEMSFICNVEEFQWTVSPGNYKRSAVAIANGVLEFYRRQAQYLNY